MAFATYVCMYYVLYLSFCYAGNLPINPSKLKTDMGRMKQTVNRNIDLSTKVTSTVVAKGMLTKGGINSNSNRLSSTSEDNASIIELFVRRSNPIGFWTRFEDVYLDDVMKDVATIVMQGGINAEIVSKELDQVMALKIYGKGVGNSAQLSVINNLKEILPQFRKIKPKELEFGYRLLVEGELISTIDRSMTKIPVTSVVSVLDMTPAIPIDVAAILGTDNSDVIETAFNRALALIDSEFVKYVIEKKVRDIYVFTDGSALLSGTSCINAFAGICIVPLLPDSNDIDSFMTSSTGSSNSNSRKNKALIPSFDNAFNISVNEIGGLVSTPFDAELSAGLFGLIITRLINRKIDASTSSSNSINYSLYTDSKTLVRAVCTGPPVDASVVDKMLIDTPSRLPLWRCMASIANYGATTTTTTATAANATTDTAGDSSVYIQWIPGHPERRESDVGKWSMFDSGIHIADQLAGSRLQTSFTLTAVDLLHTIKKL